MTLQELIEKTELEFCYNIEKELEKIRRQLYDSRRFNKRTTTFSKRNGSR